MDKLGRVSYSTARHHPPPFHVVLNQSFPETRFNINSKREAVLEQKESARIASCYPPLTTSALEKKDLISGCSSQYPH